MPKIDDFLKDLTELDAEELATKVMSLPFPLSIFANVFFSMFREVSRDAPDQIRYFRINMGSNSAGINLRMTKTGYHVLSAGAGHPTWAEAEANISDAVASSKLPNSSNTNFRDHNGGRRRPLTQLSILPPRAVAGKVPESDRCLIVVQLANKKGAVNSGKDKHKWKFSTRFAPFTLGDRFITKVTVDGNEQQLPKPIDLTKYVYLSSQIVVPETPPDRRRGSISNWLVEPVSGELGDGDTPYPDTDWACFMFDFKGLRDVLPQGATLPEFAFRFNIHVEVRDGRKSKNFIPLIIDPDVGHPGGNGP